MVVWHQQQVGEWQCWSCQLSFGYRRSVTGSEDPRHRQPLPMPGPCLPRSGVACDRGAMNRLVGAVAVALVMVLAGCTGDGPLSDPPAAAGDNRPPSSSASSPSETVAPSTPAAPAPVFDPGAAMAPSGARRARCRARRPRRLPPGGRRRRRPASPSWATRARQAFPCPAGVSWGVRCRAGDDVATSSRRRPDFDPAAPHLLVGAHLDTVPQAPGAEDNASGVAVLLELARLAARGAARGCRWCCVAFGAEEPRGPATTSTTSGRGRYVRRLAGAERRRAAGHGGARPGRRARLGPGLHRRAVTAAGAPRAARRGRRVGVPARALRQPHQRPLAVREGRA